MNMIQTASAWCWRTLLQPCLTWFDTGDPAAMPDPPPPRYRPTDLNPIRAIPFFAVHLMCLGVLWVGWSPVAVAVAAFLYFARMFAITGFYHRYFSHKTFRTGRVWQFIFALWGNSAVQRGPLWWAANHRHHHKYSDQPEDRHSAKEHGLYWSHMGWILSPSNHRTEIKAVPDLAKFPELRWLDRFDTLVPIALGVATFALGAGLNYGWPSLGTSGMQMLIWGFFISTVLLFHGTCTINSLSHIWGRRRFETTDESRNNFVLALVTMGEGWHNNHHHYPAAARQGFYWWEIDLTFYGLKLLEKLGAIHHLHAVPARVLQTQRTGPHKKDAASEAA